MAYVIHQHDAAERETLTILAYDHRTLPCRVCGGAYLELRCTDNTPQMVVGRNPMPWCKEMDYSAHVVCIRLHESIREFIQAGSGCTMDEAVESAIRCWNTVQARYPQGQLVAWRRFDMMWTGGL